MDVVFVGYFRVWLFEVGDGDDLVVFEVYVDKFVVRVLLWWYGENYGWWCGMGLYVFYVEEMGEFV